VKGAGVRRAEGVSGQPGGGKYVVIGLAADQGVIVEASYLCNGCAYAHQLSRGLTNFLKGRTIAQASKIDAEDVIAIAGPVPEGKEYYASMATQALRDALTSISSRNANAEASPSIHDSPLTIHVEAHP